MQMHTYTLITHVVRLAWNGMYYNAIYQPAPVFGAWTYSYNYKCFRMP